MRRAIPAGPEVSSVERPADGTRAMRSAPQRFVETWVDAVVGFLFCVVLPIPIYATGEPFVGEFALPGGFIGVHSGLILAAQRADQWKWNICKEALATMPEAEYQRFTVAFLAGEPWAKKRANEIDLTIKARKSA